MKRVPFVHGEELVRRPATGWSSNSARGISIASTVVQFEYDGAVCNLLDTPGHADFGEDTYRTLCAADAAVMLLDAAKGLEPQTLKLFRICRMRKLPIITFVNKLDRPALPALELLDQLAERLGITPISLSRGRGSSYGAVIEGEIGFGSSLEPSASGSRRSSHPSVTAARETCLVCVSFNCRDLSRPVATQPQRS